MHDRSAMSAFIRLPWRHYRGAPDWVPPLISEAMEALTGRVIKRYRLYERLLEEDAAPAYPG